jgi:mono/diheme cytochrome c family protein
MKNMNQFSPITRGRRAGMLLALLASVIFSSASAILGGQDTKAPAAATPEAKAEAAKPAKKAPKKKLTGAELYQINCNRCHAERYPTEFTPAQWKTIVTHMRVRANLPAAQAREILKYLQEDSGN